MSKKAKMKKYKLIKEYPGSPKLGTEIKYTGNGWRCHKTDFAIFENPDKHPKFWEEVVEKEYEILEIRGYSGDYVVQKDGSFEYKGVLYGDSKTNCYAEKYLKCDQNKFPHHIHSVKRLSDGEIFTVGDKIKTCADNSTCIIYGFEIVNDNITINHTHSYLLNKKLPGTSSNHHLHLISKIKKPLFTTDFEIISWLSNNKLESIHDEKCYFDPKFDNIQSVRRKSDNILFEVGEKIKEGFITKIIIKKDKIYLEV